MNTIVFCFAAFLVTVKTSEAGKFFNVNGTTFYISHPMNKNWFQAQRYCTLHGMYLATIHTEPQSDIILNLIEQCQIPPLHVHFWTSGTDLGQANREYYWTTSGLPVAYTNWMAGSPKVTQVEKSCILLHGNSANYKWMDIPCDGTHFFICQSHLDQPRLLSNKCQIEL